MSHCSQNWSGIRLGPATKEGPLIHHGSVCVWEVLRALACFADAMRNTGHFAAAYSGGWCVPPHCP